MNNSRESDYLLRDARIIRGEVAQSLDQKHYHRVVRKCQEAAELALKALLLHAGVEYPKVHDLSKALIEALTDRFSSRDLRRLAEISAELAEERVPAFYGSVTAPAAEMFLETDAMRAMEDCDWVLAKVSGVVEQ